MLDRYARQLIDPPLNHIGRGLAARGFTADGVTLIGLGLGLVRSAFDCFGPVRLGAGPAFGQPFGRWAGWGCGAGDAEDRFWRLSGYCRGFSVLRRDPDGLCYL